MATETTALALLENSTAVQIFEPGFIDPVIERVEAQARAEASRLDISTEANRKALASLAYKVARSKTFIDNQRLALVAEEKKRLKRIDEEGRRIWNRLETLQEEVRKPLTDWEQADKTRIACHEEALKILTDLSTGVNGFFSVADVEASIEKVHNLHDHRNWEEFAARASGQKAATLFSLHRNLGEAQKREAEAAELARLRAEAAEREQRDREERIAREATEKAEREAREREERATRAADAERERLQREHLAAEQRAKDAEMRAKLAQEKAERDAKQAAEQAERDRLAAVKAERQRAADKKAREDAEQERREASARIRKRVLGEISEAIAAFNVPPEQADVIASALAAGTIPHVTVVF